MNVLPITSKQTTDNYPYGYLKATAFFSVEFHPKRGFRFVFQTINPKNGRENKPKKSTYSDFMFMIEDENGYFKQHSYSINGEKDAQKVLQLLKEIYLKAEFTEEMLEYIKLSIIGTLAVSRAYSKDEAERENLLNKIKGLKDSDNKTFFLTN